MLLDRIAVAPEACSPFGYLLTCICDLSYCPTHSLDQAAGGVTHPRPVLLLLHLLQPHHKMSKPELAELQKQLYLPQFLTKPIDASIFPESSCAPRVAQRGIEVRVLWGGVWS